MIRETYLAILKRMREEHPEAEFIVVTATAKHILAPPWGLVKRVKKIPWDEYERLYIKWIQSKPGALQELRRIKWLSKMKDVYLVCYEKEFPCHRFILMQMIKDVED